MKNYKLTTTFTKVLADTLTPVTIYLRLRDRYQSSVLLESSDHRGTENCYSYLCFNPIASIRVENEQIRMSFPDKAEELKTIVDRTDLTKGVQDFASRFETDPSTFPFSNNGLFGYVAYDAVRYFEDIDLLSNDRQERKIPDLVYQVFELVMVLDHNKDELYIFQHSHESFAPSNTEELLGLIKNRSYPNYPFELDGVENSDHTDVEFSGNIKKAKAHCKRGDVFQMVLSRAFSQSFKGDDLNVYRALRSVNPSPYLFYFDHGDFRLFGSSPEAQVVIRNKIASVHPIAGTYKRNGASEADLVLAEKLKLDTKENAEHVMLVDLARNDLSRSCSDVTVEKFKEIQFYSHVIHLVSEVSGQIKEGSLPMDTIADTFPAGTLTGAPKHRAMQLIDGYEKGKRGFYGGCIGYMGFNGDFNSAIMIRSFLSKDNCLFFQAGAGIVESSDNENELNEVNNKLGALRSAMKIAEAI